MILKVLEVSMFGTNCYLAGCPETKEGVIIDPGAEGKRIISDMRKLGLKIKYIINTHGHVDHIAANARLKDELKVPVLLHKEDLQIYRNPGFGLGLVVGKQPQPDRFVRDGERISFGGLELEVIETPGHTRGSISLYLPGAVFTGDALFAGSIGRTDLAGGSYKELMRSIKERLITLPPETMIYPGHGPGSTIGEEAQTNPFIRA